VVAACTGVSLLNGHSSAPRCRNLREVASWSQTAGEMRLNLVEMQRAGERQRGFNQLLQRRQGAREGLHVDEGVSLQPRPLRVPPGAYRHFGRLVYVLLRLP
jgi:hypothetical protein